MGSYKFAALFKIKESKFIIRIHIHARLTHATKLVWQGFQASAAWRVPNIKDHFWNAAWDIFRHGGHTPSRAKKGKEEYNECPSPESTHLSINPCWCHPWSCCSFSRIGQNRGTLSSRLRCVVRMTDYIALLQMLVCSHTRARYTKGISWLHHYTDHVSSMYVCTRMYLCMYDVFVWMWKSLLPRS